MPQWEDTSYCSGCVDRETTVWLSKTHVKSLNGVWLTVYSLWLLGKPYDRTSNEILKINNCQMIQRVGLPVKMKDDESLIIKQKTLHVHNWLMTSVQHTLKWSILSKTQIQPCSTCRDVIFLTIFPLPSGTTAECVFLHQCALAAADYNS